MTKKTAHDQNEKRMESLEGKVAELKEALKSVGYNEKSLQQIFQAISIPAFVIDKDHTITHCNRAYEKLTGIPAESIIGTTKAWQTFYPKKRPVMADLIVDNAPEEQIKKYYRDRKLGWSIIKGGYEAEDFFPDAGGGGKWLFFTATPLKDDGGNIIGAVETLQDVTERKEVEKKLRETGRRLNALLDFFPQPIVVSSLDGGVYYLNPAFTKTFGWTLEELEGGKIPYTPQGLEEETGGVIKRLLKEKIITHHETKRLTKDGRLLDVVLRGAVYSEEKDEPAGQLVTLRDVTREKRIARNNEAILRISTTLPEYPDLEGLSDYVSQEVKRYLESEGALLILLDEEEQELFFLGAAYDDSAIQKKVKEIRFPMDKLVAGRVIKTGQPIIVSDPSEDPKLFRERDEKLGYHTRNLLLVPMKSSDRTIGVLCAINKKEGDFDETHTEMLNLIAGTVALSVENARFSEELKKAYRNVSSMNRAKDKAIGHLSHELKTPISILSGSLHILRKKMRDLPEGKWKSAMERGKRNLDRISEIQSEAEDIMQGRADKYSRQKSFILDQFSDQLESLIEEELGEGPVMNRIREKIEEIYGSKDLVSEEILLNEFVKDRIDILKPLFEHRKLILDTFLEPSLYVFLPKDSLQKIVDGLIRNAIENTPDEGKVEISVIPSGSRIDLVVKDFGVGITKYNQNRIFDGYFSTQETMDYSSRRPFDFNAGGKGADLLRMKIFSERYNFDIKMTSSRCTFLKKKKWSCPGRISECTYCSNVKDCHVSGGTTFTVSFPSAK
jgi:PAS domain S-box-containing protein